MPLDRSTRRRKTRPMSRNRRRRRKLWWEELSRKELLGTRICDLENNNLRVMEMGLVTDKAELKERKATARALKRLNGMLTPMSKPVTWFPGVFVSKLIRKNFM